MSAIDTQNTKNIRQKMSISVILGATSDPILTLTDADIISCELNLRADLAPIDPTLPESEIVVSAYWPDDLTDEALGIKNDTVITYQAGYSGDMSPVRTFYLSERIEWEDNILTIRGVDAVHFLDDETFPLFIGNIFGFNATAPSQDWRQAYDAHRRLYAAFCDQIETAGINVISKESSPSATASGETTSNLIYGVIERQPRRDVIANMMNLLHQDYATGYYNGFNSIWFSYIDAGRPTIKAWKPSSLWDIYEADCGDIKKHLDDRIVSINANLKRCSISLYTYPGVGDDANQIVGKADILKNGGAAVKLDTLASVLDYSYKTTAKYYNTVWRLAFPNDEKIIADTSVGSALPLGTEYDSLHPERCYGKVLYDDKNATWQSWNDDPTDTTSTSWRVSSMWSALVSAGVINSSASSVSVEVRGGAYNLTDEKKSYSIMGDGVTVEPSKTTWAGKLFAYKYGSTTQRLNILPDEGFKSLLNRSNETGSFTWKGDPRMQPRDVFTFHYLDGSTEIRTIESINLKHEGGGTIAEISYRKGIV